MVASADVEDAEDAAAIAALHQRHIATGSAWGVFSVIQVKYYRKFSLPGRRYAQGPSIQKVPGSLRNDLLSGGQPVGMNFFLDVDIAQCMPTLFLRELEEIVGTGGLEEFEALKACVAHYDEIRGFVQEYYGISAKDAKKMMLSLFFFRKPLDDLPFLWALSYEIHKAADIILAEPKFAYLKDKFADRRNPRASRLSYALQSLEDSIISDLENEIKDKAPSVQVTAYMFDGLILQVTAASAPLVHEAAETVGKSRNVNFKIKPFMPSI
jgi:hypothetical protein